MSRLFLRYFSDGSLNDIIYKILHHNLLWRWQWWRLEKQKAFDIFMFISFRGKSRTQHREESTVNMKFASRELCKKQSALFWHILSFMLNEFFQPYAEAANEWKKKFYLDGKLTQWKFVHCHVLLHARRFLLASIIHAIRSRHVSSHSKRKVQKA